MDNTITFKTDAATKKAAKSLAKEVGLSLDEFITDCLARVIIDHHLTTDRPTPASFKLRKILNEAERELAAGDFIGPFSSYKEAVEALDKAVENERPKAS